MTKFNPNKHHRRSIRLKNYDYTQPGAYFVTICTHQRECLFGTVEEGIVQLNAFGQIVNDEWFKSATIRREIEMDEFVIMPNHLHGIVNIVASPVGANGRVGANGHSPLQPSPPQQKPGAAPKSLGAFITGFKSTVTKQINQLRGAPGQPVWQRNYYEHIIRNERALHAIRQYIRQNPLRWHLDRYNSAAVGPDPQAAELWQLLQ